MRRPFGRRPAPRRPFSVFLAPKKVLQEKHFLVKEPFSIFTTRGYDMYYFFSFLFFSSLRTRARGFFLIASQPAVPVPCSFPGCAKFSQAGIQPQMRFVSGSFPPRFYKNRKLGFLRPFPSLWMRGGHQDYPPGKKTALVASYGLNSGIPAGTSGTLFSETS